MASSAPANRPKLRENQIVDVTFGADVEVVQPVNIYGCEIGAGSFVGPFTEIQRGVEIGTNCRIQSHTFICEKVSIGNDCFVGHGVSFVNDLFENGGPALGDQSKWKPTFIGNSVSIGSNATILPVRIVDGTVIGAGSVVTRDILEAGVYAGNPARLFRTFPE